VFKVFSVPPKDFVLPSFESGSFVVSVFYISESFPLFLRICALPSLPGQANPLLDIDQPIFPLESPPPPQYPLFRWIIS